AVLRRTPILIASTKPTMLKMIHQFLAFDETTHWSWLNENRTRPPTQSGEQENMSPNDKKNLKGWEMLAHAHFERELENLPVFKLADDRCSSQHLHQERK